MCGQCGVYSTWILFDGDSDSAADSSPIDRIDYWNHYIDWVGEIIDPTAKGRRLKRIQHPLSGECDGIVNSHRRVDFLMGAARRHMPRNTKRAEPVRPRLRRYISHFFYN